MSGNGFALSTAQEELWLAEPDGPQGRVVVVADLPEGSDPAAALRHAADRHEILRTSFPRQPLLHLPLQVVHDELPGDPAFPDNAADTVEEALRAELTTPFDLERGPLVRGRLVQRADGGSALVLAVSCLCADRDSAQLLARELTGADELEKAPVQHADFAAWEAAQAEEGAPEAEAATEHWSALADAAGPAVPFARPASGGFVPGAVPLALDEATDAALEKEAARYGATREAFLVAAWAVALARASGEDELVLAGAGLAPRPPELAGAVGPYDRRLPLRVRTSSTFAETLHDVVRGLEAARPHAGHLPAGGAAGLPVGFVLARGNAVSTAEGLRLWLELGERLELRHDPSWLAYVHVARLARSVECALRSAAARPEAAVADLETVPEDERRALVAGPDENAAPVPRLCVHELIEAQASTNPAHVAVTDGRDELTYAGLDAAATLTARRLARAGVAGGDAVGLCTDRSMAMVVGLLGILKAGAAYVPLNFEHPAARLAGQLAATGARIVVTQSAVADRVPSSAEVVLLDADEPGPAEAEPRPTVSPDDLAYVIFTSGSTGTPKGVEVTHANLVAYVEAIVRELDADTQRLSFGLVTAISTDLGNTAVFPALCSGGTLVLVSPADAADPADLVRRLDADPVDVLKIAPSHLAALLAARDGRVLPRRTLVCGGERLSWELVDDVRELADCAILNHYGPTETTVGCCTYRIPETLAQERPASVPIGSPIANAACYVLDAALRPVPVGAPGRLFVSGAGVARGYAGDAEGTAQRFLPDPFSPGYRMYDTGDVVRRLPDGTLEFLGRADDQVKIRGYRVEPGEVETALRSHPRVQGAVVASRGEGADARLVAWCAAPGASEAELRGHLAGLLPEPMLPSVLVVLDALPLTPSGKVDRAALPELSGGVPRDRVPPRTPVERAVAAIWSDVLGVDKIGVDEDFFTLGGHSLLATQVVAEVRSGLAVELPLHSLFTCPTVASLSAEIVRLLGEADGETAALLDRVEQLPTEEAERLPAEPHVPGPSAE